MPDSKICRLPKPSGLNPANPTESNLIQPNPTKKNETTWHIPAASGHNGGSLPRWLNELPAVNEMLAHRPKPGADSPKSDLDPTTPSWVMGEGR
jgi:hypothetical protein